MREGSVKLKEYRDSDYSAWESLVDNAWGFVRNLYLRGLAALGRYLYTMGSIAMSEYRMVLEYNNEVIGFIFGYNE